MGDVLWDVVGYVVGVEGRVRMCVRTRVCGGQVSDALRQYVDVGRVARRCVCVCVRARAHAYVCVRVYECPVPHGRGRGE